MNQIELCQQLLKLGMEGFLPDSRDNIHPVKFIKKIKIKRGTQLFDLHESDIRETDDEIIIE